IREKDKKEERPKKAIINEEENTELTRLREYFNLQGPFYVLDLGQGTLHDLLEKSIPWSSLPSYSVSNFKSSLLAQQDRVSQAIDEFTKHYLDHHPTDRSGYS